MTEEASQGLSEGGVLSQGVATSRRASPRLFAQPPPAKRVRGNGPSPSKA